MGRPSDSREALIAEALGDFGKLLDRIDAMTPRLNDAREALDLTAAKLLGSIEPFRERIVTMALTTQNRAVGDIAQQANLVARKTFDEQTRAMQESARGIFRNEVEKPLRRLQGELRHAIEKAHRPWDDWLTHTATALSAATCTWVFLVYLAPPPSGTETKPVANAASPDCAGPPARPEKARARK